MTDSSVVGLNELADTRSINDVSVEYATANMVVAAIQSPTYFPIFFSSQISKKRCSFITTNDGDDTLELV